MSPQRQLSNFIDTLLLAYVLTNNTKMQEVKKTIIEDYRQLNDKCDSIILKIQERKSKAPPKS